MTINEFIESYRVQLTSAHPSGYQPEADSVRWLVLLDSTRGMTHFVHTQYDTSEPTLAAILEGLALDCQAYDYLSGFEDTINNAKVATVVFDDLLLELDL